MARATIIAFQEEVGELDRIHLPDAIRELPVMRRAIAASMAVDDDVVGRVGDHQISSFALHEPVIAVCGERVAAEHAMLTQLPQIKRVDQ